MVGEPSCCVIALGLGPRFLRACAPQVKVRFETHSAQLDFSSSPT